MLLLLPPPDSLLEPLPVDDAEDGESESPPAPLEVRVCWTPSGTPVSAGSAIGICTYMDDRSVDCGSTTAAAVPPLVDLAASAGDCLPAPLDVLVKIGCV